MKLVEEASYNKYDLEWVKRVKVNLNNCLAARRRGEWNNLLNAIGYPSSPGSLKPYAWPELDICRVEALLKLSRVGEAHQTALRAAALKVEPLPSSFSQPQTRFFLGMLCRAYLYFVESQLNFALERYDDAAEYAAKALEIEPHNTEIKIFKKNVELVQRALSSSKLEKWAEAVRDYEIVHEALPYDKVIAKSLCQAQVALKQSRREVVLNMESGGDVKEISSLEELKAALARPDKSVKIIYF
ncbi:TPR repeat-containing thioredoxin TTL2-like [Raphanus sativus]|uniref:TPR repeat-containing thioredoxin TTL2-like n=1 Tax=Raphanus sativus TaxID=3726 RepID=A0A6J0JIM6_RAPSA|nr:TPR repeat-containing thioredoxin TTL2-like [Raphanus sativus]